MKIIKQLKERIFLKKFDKMIEISMQLANAHGYDLNLNQGSNLEHVTTNFIEFVKYRSNQEKDSKSDINVLSASVIEPLSYYFCFLNIVNNDNVYEITIDKRTKHIILFDNKYNSGLEVDAYNLLNDVLLNNVKFERLEYIMNLLFKIATKKLAIEDIENELKIINSKTLIK